VDSDEATGNSLPALVHIDAITVDGSSLDPQIPIRFSSARQRITFEYTGLSLSNAERVRYRYRLDGFDHDWSEPTTIRTAIYTNLNPGSYRFRVIASNSDGLWKGAEAGTDLTVLPTLWQTWWFRLGLLLCTVIVALAVYRLRMQQLKRLLRARFEARLAERTQIARELHDSLLQNVQGLILKFDAIAKRRPATDPAGLDIEKILDFADQVMAQGRDRVRSLRSETVSFGELPAAFQQVAEESAPNRTSAFRTVVEGGIRELHPTIREECYSIGREAIINALQHSQCRSIEVEIIYEPREFRLRIRDDGHGIDPAVLAKGGRDHHWGLRGMRERADRIGAKLELWSRPESGTEVDLTVPGASAYRTHGGKTDSQPKFRVAG
jgi:signal transduction histidine kinase